MSRASSAGFVGILLVAAYLGYQSRQRVHMATDGSSNRDLLAGIATEIKAHSLALTPTKTPYTSPTPTKTPRPATETPHPTYAGQDVPGLYIVLPATEPVPVAMTVEAVGIPMCRDVTPSQYVVQPCEVRGHE